MVKSLFYRILLFQPAKLFVLYYRTKVMSENNKITYNLYITLDRIYCQKQNTRNLTSFKFECIFS